MLFYSLEVLSLIECYWVVREIFIKCGAEGCGNPSPFHIKPKAHAEEEEMSEDEQRRSKLLGDIAEDNPVLGELRSRKEKAAHSQIGRAHV